MRIRASSSPSESSRSGSFGIGASIGVSRCVQLLQTSPIPPPNLHDVPSPIASSSTGLKGDLRSNPRTRPSVVRVSPATTDERACSVWTRTARSPHRTTNPARDRASKTCSAVLCAGQQPAVTWVGLSLKGSPLASASVRLTPGPREGAHYELPPPSPPLPPPPSPPPPPPTAFAAPPPHCRRHLRRSHCRRHSLLPASSARQTAADAANAADASCMREPALPRARVPACVPSRARARSLHRTAPHSTQRAACAS